MIKLGRIKYFKNYFGIALIILILPTFFLLSCSKKEESRSSAVAPVNCSSSRSLNASTKVPLLLVRVQYANTTFQSSETSWANRMFGNNEGQLNHYLDEITYGKFQFTPASETSGCKDDGVVTVNMSDNHPNTQTNSWACYASKAISATDSNINFASFDTDGNSKLSVNELQVIFLVAGGESASGINSPGGVWAMATSLLCDANGDNTIADESGEHGITLDTVRFLGMNTSDYGQNGFSQFGERQGSSSSNTWDATIGVIAHELGHAYFLLPDLYCTSGTCSGIGNFGLMGGGSWGRKSISEYPGATPIHFSAWSSEKLNICTPQTTDNGTNSITLPAVFQRSIHASLCGIYKVSTPNSGEYFLFENRSSGGYDKGLNYIILDGSTTDLAGTSYNGGLAIWHVNDIYSSCFGNARTNDCQTRSPPLLDLEEAKDGDLDNGSSQGRSTHLFYNSNSGTFDNSTSPSSMLYDNSSSGIFVNSISVAGDNMTITISK